MLSCPSHCVFCSELDGTFDVYNVPIETEKLSIYSELERDLVSSIVLGLGPPGCKGWQERCCHYAPLFSRNVDPSLLLHVCEYPVSFSDCVVIEEACDLGDKKIF